MSWDRRKSVSSNATGTTGKGGVQLLVKRYLNRNKLY